jgi:tetratricopeptide (TPR) repeat protein
MELSLRIKENIAFDSVGAALKVYASIELLLYQNKIPEALRKIRDLAEGRARLPKQEVISQNLSFDPNDKGDSVWTSFSNYTILDDVYWLEANIRMQRGEFEKSIGLLQKILDDYPDDILADDAYFLQGEIYERQLGHTDKAMEVYREFLNKFPGSVYAAEARKRFRALRGDFKDHLTTPPNGLNN